MLKGTPQLQKHPVVYYLTSVENERFHTSLQN
jgi:hypothetical protein